MNDIIIRNLSLSFGEKNVLKDFSAVIPAGKTTCVTGPSGSGKTSLTRILCGLARPDSGTVEGMQGVRTAVVFQEDRLCPNISALTNVCFVASVTKAEASEALSRLGLGQETLQIAGTLSGGQLRRVAIARALVSDWDVLVMDEPFKGLDERTKFSVMEWVREKSRGKTVILISHDNSECAFFEPEKTISLGSVDQ
ncbi:MAG: ABC transporter ATP-binding protein [Spirochaetales bacterium]|nr:ABC transporter ATP-binding protein [Spirochaetales bacterium]